MTSPEDPAERGETAARGRPDGALADAHGGGDLLVGQIEIETQGQHSTLPVWQAAERTDDLAALLLGHDRGLGRAGRRLMRRFEFDRGAPAAQDRPAAVEHRRPDITEGFDRVLEVRPAPEQAEKRLLHDVLGCASAAQHDVR
jgi:hypothetical protein